MLEKFRSNGDAPMQVLGYSVDGISSHLMDVLNLVAKLRKTPVSVPTGTLETKTSVSGAFSPRSTGYAEERLETFRVFGPTTQTFGWLSYICVTSVSEMTLSNTDPFSTLAIYSGVTQ